MKKFRSFVGNLLRKWASIGMTIVPPTRHGAIIYYTFFNKAFWREMWCVYSGKELYNSNIKNPSEGSALLRRNIHRIEKGLSMPERRPAFALDYIDETINAFLHYERSATIDPNERQWFEQVLAAYFKVVDCSNELLKDLSNRFFEIEGRQQPQELLKIPYPASSRPCCLISPEAFQTLCMRRRSVRFFENRRVPRELLDQAIEAARQSPSACNRQPFHFRVFDDPEEAASVAKIAMGTAGYSHNIPCLLVVSGLWNSYPEERDRHVPYIDGSLASMVLMLALEVGGLSSCPINWPDLEYAERTMSRRLNLPAWERPIMLIAVGYPRPEGLVPFSEKKKLEAIRSYQ